MTSLRTLGYAAMAVGTTVVSARWLLPYVIGTPHVLIMPAVVLALCSFVVLLEVPTRRRTRARLESDASLQIAVWEYSAAAWPEVARLAPVPGWKRVVGSSVLTGVLVALVAGVTTDDVRALILGGVWAAVWACALQAFFTYRDARLLRHPHRRLRMTRSVVMLGPQLFLLNPEPAIPELSRSARLLACEASVNAGGTGPFAGTITWTCVVLARNSRGRAEYRFLIPREHAHDVSRVVAAYTEIAAVNRADPAMALPS